jgi:hypothetical protein
MTGPGGARPRRRWVLGLLLLGLLTALVGTPTWVHAVGLTAVGAPLPVPVSGSQAAPEVLAAALAVLAAGAALALVGRSGRWVVVVVLVGCAGIVGNGGARVLADPARVAAPAVAARTGLDALAGPPTSTAWPWLAIGCALVLLAAAVGIGLQREGWRSGDRRHDRPAGDDVRSDWDALSRGLDPSLGEPGAVPPVTGDEAGPVADEDRPAADDGPAPAAEPRSEAAGGRAEHAVEPTDRPLG